MNSVLHVPDSVVIGDVNVLNLQATHPFAQDLEFHLRSPANTDVLLLQGKCGDNDNFNLSLDDSAALTLESPNACDDGQAHQPQQPLSAFNGQNASGQWTLVVRDDAGGDVGTLTGWSLQICAPSGGATPTPTATPTPIPCDPGGSDLFSGGNSTGGTSSATITVPPGLLLADCKALAGTCTINGSTLTYSATVGPGETAGFEVFYAVAPDVPAGTKLCSVGSSQGSVFSVFGRCFTACGIPPGCHDYHANDLPKDLPGFGSPLTSTITIPPGSGTVGHLSVLGLTADTFDDHFYSFHLIGPAPAQTNVSLINQRCNGNDRFFLGLDDSAGPDLTAVTSCSDGVPHIPEGSLSAFNGQNAQGTWTLRVDTSATDLPGQLTNWGLRVCARPRPRRPRHRRQPAQRHRPRHARGRLHQAPTRTFTPTRSPTTTSTRTPTPTRTFHGHGDADAHIDADGHADTV